MTEHKKDFPYEEIRKEPNGDYFHSAQELLNMDYNENQIWSIVHEDDEYDDEGEPISTITYGPAHHYINVIGYIATEEVHDENTYYHETF